MGVFAHNSGVFAHNWLIYIKRKAVFVEKWGAIHCGMEKSPYLCIVKRKQVDIFNRKIVLGKRLHR